MKYKRPSQLSAYVVILTFTILAVIACSSSLPSTSQDIATTAKDTPTAETTVTMQNVSQTPESTASAARTLEPYPYTTPTPTSHQSSIRADVCMSVSEIPITECSALVAFYNSTDGPHWTFKRGWLETSQPCNWAGVTCLEGHVITIAMNYNELRGNLPSNIGDLPNLQTLSLYFNHLNGSIPPELGHLSNLQTLILHNNKLSGSIPPELGKLSSLKKLDLESNNLDGSIPAELGNLTNLEMLNLNNNNLSGSIPPELGNLANLRGLFLAGNDLSGNIPDELGNLSNLWMLNVNFNKLSGKLPPKLENLPGSGYDYFDWAKNQSSDQQTQ